MTSPAIAPMDVDTAIADAANAAIASVAPDTDTTPASPNAAPPTSASAPTAADVDDDPLADEVDATDADAETEPSEADAVTLPEGFVVVEPVVEGLVTDFTLKDADGDELEIPALIVEYKANGKVRTDRLDQVVKLAQFGVYNQEREQRVQVVEQEAREVAQQREEIAQMLAEREAQLERLLTDDDFYLAVQERFNAENSPERRAARAEEQLKSLQIQQQLEQISSTGEAFLQSELAPALSLITQALPTIQQDELDERLAVAMQAHLVMGPGNIPYLPESRYAAVRKYIVEDLAPWAQMVHMTRSEAQRDPEKERLAAERDQARIESQKAKRQIGQSLKPVTRSPNAAPARPKARPIATVDDAVDSALSVVLSSLR